MHCFPSPRSGLLVLPLVCLMLLAGCRSPSLAEVSVRELDLEVTLDMPRQALSGHARFTLQETGGGPLTLLLAPQTRITALSARGRELTNSFRSGRLDITVPPGTGSAVLEVTYQARFNDPFPERPVVTDNPGYGVTGTITDGHVFLLAGSGWYPRPAKQHPPTRLTVRAPAGLTAVTAGELVALDSSTDETVSTWRIRNPVQGLALSVGPYERRFLRDGTTVSTFFFSGNSGLADGYLRAVRDYLDFYGNLHGPYPFDKFAVVENFFPTGYGFPSYTLIGSRILRLPFIIETSLRHEVAHSWWGNGVLVANTGGNWCEGLTAYVADYLAKELTSAQKALEHRRQWLRDYTLLVDEGAGFALAAFSHRTSPASQAIGYGKSAFVFHMLRRLMGDEAFWEGLRGFYADWLFKPATWSDLMAHLALTAPAALDLETFQDQWIERPGAPRLKLENVEATPKDGIWTVTGTLVQEAPFFDLLLPLVLSTAQDSLNRAISSSGPRAPFSLVVDAPPARLEVDPQAHVFRRLAHSEIPPSVNSLKGADRLAAILARGYPKSVAKLLLTGLNHPAADMFDEDKVSPDSLRGRDLLFFGVPRSSEMRALLQPLPSQAQLDTDRLDLSALLPPEALTADSLFLTLPPAGENARTRALFYHTEGTPVDHSLEAARKITHYGRYSLLAFAQGTNLAKLTWDPENSPLIHLFSGARP